MLLEISCVGSSMNRSVSRDVIPSIRNIHNSGDVFSQSSKTVSAKMRLCLKSIESSDLQMSMCRQHSSSSSHFGHAETSRCFLHTIIPPVVVSSLIHCNIHCWIGNDISFLALQKIPVNLCG